jgi:hypothetical protein
VDHGVGSRPLGVIARLRLAIAGRTGLLGAIGAIALLVGGSWYQATVLPPYRFIDEQAHAGYVLEVQDGRLPTIDTPIDAEAGGPALQERLASEPERRRDVWVANNPPLAYVVAAVPAAATRALGLSGGPLLGLRLANVAAVGVAIALAYLLARDLAGGDQVVGAVGAGLVAATPHLGFVAALGFTDGLSLLATTGVTLALARLAGAGAAPVDPLRAARTLGIWCAAAAAARPMALALALVAGAIGLGVTWWRREAPLGRAAAWIGGPTVVLAGWWYVLNVVRYGDPTGSDALFEKFGRQPTGTLWDSLTLRGAWESAYRTITTRRLEAPLPTDPRSWYQATLVVGLVGIVGAVVLVARSALAHRGSGGRPTGGDGALPGVAWLSCAALSVVPIVLTAQHRAGGGAPHPRYLLPMLPIVAAAVALAAVRLGTRWTGLALVGGLSAITWLQTSRASDWLAANPVGPEGSELVTSYGTQLTRGAGAVVAAAGLALLVAAVALAPSRR